MTRCWIPVAAAVAMFGPAGCGPTTAESTCDRLCLIEIGGTYIDALAANNPSLTPLADDLAFVENIERMRPGEGLWAITASVSSGFRIDVPDADQGTLGMIVKIERRTAPGAMPELLAIRLKIVGQRITEAEHLVGDIQPAANPADLDTPRPNLVAIVPEDERMPHTELGDIAARYYEGLVTSNSGIVPFADDCERQENGLITAGWKLPPATFDSVDVNGNSPPPVARDCIGQMNSARFAYIDSIDNRRIFAIDPVQGLAMGLSHFRQSMNRGPLEMIAADGSRVMWEEEREPYDLPAAHIFKITNGEIHEIEAIGIFVPYRSPTGWE